MDKKRIVWIDNVKVLACILVVLGHFFQSLVKADIISNGPVYGWFNTTIYYFHVPLFFICSGFVYQKYSVVRSFYQWKTNVFKKLASLGIPFIVFSVATWLLKKYLSSSVNTLVEQDLLYSLFINPIAPYWYLYSLFIIFVLTPTVKNKTDVYVLASLSIVCKTLVTFFFSTGIYAIDVTAANWIWFVAGILIAEHRIPLLNNLISFSLFIVFIIASVLIQRGLLVFRGNQFIMGIIACYSIVCIIYNISENKPQQGVFTFLSKYTMPIFLMHTLFAAPVRILLLKLGISSSFVHIPFGMIISFAGPIIAMIILEKLKPLDFVIYPNKYLRTRR